MTRRNKLYYQTKGNQFPSLITTGNVYLRHLEEEEIAAAQKGDLQIYLSTDSLTYNTHVGDYKAMGYEGYLKAEVHNGKGWCPLSLEEYFPKREYYFGKRERPIDTYNLCIGHLRETAGTELMRTYREHYVIAPQKLKEED